MPSFGRSFLAVLLITALFSLGAVALDPARSPDAVAIRKWEDAALAAELANDDRFFADNLHVDWTLGTNTGRFQSRRDFIRDVHDGDPNLVVNASIEGMDVRVHGDTAIATYQKDYEVHVLDDRLLHTGGDRPRHADDVAVHLLVTDTFVRDGGRWLQLASHASTVEPPDE